MNNSNFLHRLKRLRDITSLEFRGMVLVVAVILIFISFKITLSRFNSTDVIPRVKPINTAVIKQFGEFAVKAKVGMFFKNIPVFDVRNDTFQIDAIVWFVFNPDEITLEIIEKFSFDKGKILQKSPPDLRVLGDKVFVKYNVLFAFNGNLNYHKFPFEDHQVAFILSNDFVTPNEMYFMADSSSFCAAPEIFPANWKLQDLNIEPGFIDLELDQQDKTNISQSPKVLYTIRVAKASIKGMLVLFIPLFAAVFFSLFTFLMNLTNSKGKFTLALSALTALLSYRFVIERVIPDVAYFTKIDEIYLLFLIITFLCLLFQLIFTREYAIYIEQHKNLPLSAFTIWRKINAITFIIVCILFITSTMYLILT
ncbi:MAG: hypothetical protein V1855_00870 [bacterium]